MKISIVKRLVLASLIVFAATSTALGQADPYAAHRIPSGWAGHTFTPSPADWRKIAVYQIMTDRFANGDANNDHATTFSTAYDANSGDYPQDQSRRTIGGDFKGLTANLDYIKSLGFDAIWISAPLMGAEPNGYAPTTYGILDPKLGTADEFRTLINEAHARGMYVVIDCVANHFANWFNDHDAFNGGGYGSHSYKYGSDRNYGGNFGDPLGPNDFHNNGNINNWNDGFQLEQGELVGLDDLKTENEWVRNYVIERWSNFIKAFDVDGFRVDAIKHININDMATMAQAWRAAAASVGKTNFYMFGEAFSGSHGAVGYYTGNKAGTGKRIMNGMMDYAMYMDGVPWKLFNDQWGLKNWIAGMNNGSYDMGQGDGATTWSFANMNLHFADNHDNPRFLSTVGDWDQMAAVTGLLTTIEGVGGVYYGSEQAFNTGGKDGRGAYSAMFDHPYQFDNAAGDNFNQTFYLYRNIARIMRARRAIGSGLGFGTDLLDPQNGIFAFKRGADALVAINGTSGDRTATFNFGSGSFTDLVNARTVTGPSASISLPKYGVGIFVRNGNAADLEPMVEAVTPAFAARTDVSTVTLTFDRDMDQTTTTAAASISPDPGGTWSVSGRNLTLIGGTFNKDWMYTVRVNRSAKSFHGRAMYGGFSSKFWHTGGVTPPPPPPPPGTVVSPEVNGDKVTFRYSGGTTVAVKGSWKVTSGAGSDYTAIYDATWNGGAKTAMVNTGGVWAVTLTLDPSKTYEYGFDVNGVWTNDPANSVHATNGNDKFTTGTSGPVIPVNNDQPQMKVNGVDGNYGTTRVFIDESRGDRKDIAIEFAPNSDRMVTTVECFTNLDRRDFATLTDLDASLIVPNSPLPTYFKAYTMYPGGIGYSYTLPVSHTGVYRVTVRYKVQGDPNWRWFSNGSTRRDAVVVASPEKARNLNMYELQVNAVEATDDNWAARSTFADLTSADNDGYNPISVDSLRNQGINTVWLQPIHPIGSKDEPVPFNQQGDPGSPYAVKNFFAVNQVLGADNTREGAMQEFKSFVAEADQKGLNVFFDVTFNHSAWDVEVGPAGLAMGAAPTSQVRDVRPSWYTRRDPMKNYLDSTAYLWWERARNRNEIAVAPADRHDFGKWADVTDFYFGTYSALGSPKNEADGLWNHDSTVNELVDYFANYSQFWLDQTGNTGNQSQSQMGIDGFRCDFAQGVPPQAWEYIINKTRARKWDFIFMAESLDGGEVSRRAARQFDIVNDNWVWSTELEFNPAPWREAIERHKSAYDPGMLILRNVITHDHHAPEDPWMAAMRTGIHATVDGVPLVFAGMERGLKLNYGYAHVLPQYGRYHMNFKTWNDMTLLWDSSPVGMPEYYAGVMRAREQSPALRSGNQWFLFQKNGAAHAGIFAVAKWDGNDVVLAFVNMHYWSAENGIFDLGGALGPGATRLALRPGRPYNVVNLASSDPSRRLWSQPRTTEDILANGIYVGFNGKKQEDGQVAQYLKLIDASTGPDPNLIETAPASPTANDIITIKIGRAGKLLWGVNASGGNWERPIAAYRPTGTTEFGATAVESPFSGPDAEGKYTLQVGPFNNASQSIRTFDYVIHYADNTWNNNSGADFHATITPVVQPVDTVPPAAPTGLTGISGVNAVNLTWNANTEPDLSRYSVYVKSAFSGTFIEAGTRAPIGKDTGLLAYNLTGGTEHQWYVVAIDNAGNISAPSATIIASPLAEQVDTQLPATPTGLTAIPGAEKITLRWTANTEPDLDGYDVYDRTYSNGVPQKVNASRITGTEFVVNNLAASVQYTYYIVAVDHIGNISQATSTVYAIPTPGIDTFPPAAPTGVTAVGGTNQIVVSWTRNGEFDVDGYYVNTRPVGSTAWSSLGLVTATTFTHTGLVAGAAHEYYVAARDAAGNTSVGSTVATGRVLGSNTGKPPIYISFLWHMHQPIYYPGESLTQTEGAGRYGFSPVGVHFDRTGPYTTWPMDAVQNAANAGLEHAAAQVSFSGSLAENLDNLEQTGRGFFGWKNRWHESNFWKTSLGNPRVDLVAFGYHHPLMTLVDNDIVRQQIRDHRDKYLQTWNKNGVPQRNYSRGMFPAENAFAERNIPALVDEGIEWVMVDNIHFQRAAQGYPWNSGGNLYPPNKADQQNANPNDWVQLNGVWAPTKVSARWSMQPHYVQSVDPVSGQIKRIIAVPTERYMGNEDGRGGFGALQYEAVMSQIESQNTDPNHPAIIVLHHDGDNYGGGTEAYYHSNFDGFINWVKSNPSRFQFIGVQDYLQMFPPDPSDIVHVEAGSWAGADNGDPEFMKWNGDPNAATGYSPDYNSWGVMMAAANRVLTANAIAPSDNNVNQAMRHLLNGFASDYWYWDGTEIWDGLPAVASNLAVNLVDPVIPNGADVVAPTLYAPQREPYNPGELEWGTTAKPRDFEVWTWGYDVSGIQSINVKYRVDVDGVNPIQSTQNEVYGDGAEVGTWITISMSVKNFAAQVASPQPHYRATMYSAMITGLSGKLVDYYIEATDNRGNNRRSPIEHVWVGTGGSGGGTQPPVGVSWNPGAPSADQTITISSGKAGKLHWGINNWVAPPAEYRPAGSTVMSTMAIQSAMSDPDGDGVFTVAIGPFVGSTAVTKIDFVIAHTDGTWNSNGGADFHITVGPPMNSNARDTIAPVITLGAIPDSTYASSVAVSGSVNEPASAVKVNGAAVSLSAGAFSSSVALTIGANTITITATDTSNNTATVTRSVTRATPPETTTPDVTPPTLTLDTIPASTTSDQVVVVGWIDDLRCTVTVNGIFVMGWSSQPYIGRFVQIVPLTFGANTITVIATDTSLNSTTRTLSITRTLPVVVDTTAPVLTLDPTAGTTTNVTIAIAGSVSDATAVVKVNGAAVTLDGNLRFSSVVNLALGSNTIAVTATDPSGNIGTASVGVIRETVVIVPPVDAPPAQPSGLVAAGGVNQVTLGWNANTEHDIAGYYVNFRTVGAASWTSLGLVTATNYAHTGLTAGTTYEYYIAAKDNGGLTGVGSATASAAPISGGGGQVPIYIAYHWHMHQPVYWPGENIVTTYSTRPNYSFVRDVVGWPDRVDAYTHNPIDNVDRFRYLPNYGAQISYSGSLVENLDNMAAVGHSYGNGWSNRYAEGHSWKTSLGNSRVDLVAFGYHHPLMPLIDERDMRLQIQMHRRKITGRFGQPYSKGIFPPESAFSERMIPGLVAEGIEWAMVDNLHIDHANKNFPWTLGEKINPPNRADAVNPPSANYVNLACQTNTNYNVSPTTLRPHFTKYVDPNTGTEMRMIVVPLERSLGYDDSYGDRTPQARLEALLQYNTDPAHPILIVLAHDGDNAGASGFRYYVETMGWIGGADPNKFRLTTVQDYLTQFPPSPTDVVHVTDGSWVGADLGDQELHKWMGDPVKSGQVNFDEGYSSDWNSWMVVTAGKNRILTAEAIQAPSADIQAIIDGSGNAVDKGWHDFLGGEVSCYWYWDGTVQWDEQPTRSTDNAMNHVDPIINGAAGTDPIPPTLFSLQREPYNPGGEEAYKGTQPSDFRVFTFGYDVNGITNIVLKYRVDEDGENPLSNNVNDVYADGAGVGAWVSVPMTVKNFPNPPAAQLQPRYRAAAYEGWVRGLSNTLVDYYVEAVDGRGNTTKTAIHHVYIGASNLGGGGTNPTGVNWTPTAPAANQTITVSSPKAGKLHWGVNGWNAPDAAYRPAGTTVFSTQAVQTPMAGPDANGRYTVTIGPFTGTQIVTSIKFVIAHTDGSWNNNSGSDFNITVAPAGSGPSDTTAPVITLNPVIDSTTASIANVSGMIDDASATVKVNGATVALTAGAFSTSVALNLGVNTITVTATDASNNTATLTHSVTRGLPPAVPDTIAPVITLNPLAPTTVDATLTISGSVSEPATVKINNVATAVAANRVFSAAASLVVGQNTITVTATDAAGNVGTTSVGVIRMAPVDTRASWTPTAPGANDVITISVRKAGKLHWGVNAWKKPDAAYWPAGSVAWDTYSIETPFVGPDASGAYTLRIGPFNGAVAVAEVDFVLHYNDNTWDNNANADYKIAVTPAPAANRAPTVSILSPANGASVSGQVSITATAADDRSIAGIRFKVDGTEVGPVATTTIGGGAGTGQIRGGRKTITIDGANTSGEWTEAMRLASDPAWDHANVVNGAWSTHETPFDYTDLYAAWDDQFLYIGFQIVDITDIKDPSNAGSSAGTTARSMNLPQFIALDVVPGGYTGVTAAGANAGQYDAWHKGHLWNNGGGVDYQIYFASNFWQGPFLVPYAGAWNADANTIKPSLTGLSGKSGAGNARGLVFDASGTEYVAQGHNKARDSFFEIRIPLANIGNPNLDAQSVGIFIAHGDGDMKAGVDCIPNDPATTNTPGVEVWNSPKEWADIDIYTSPFVKAGVDGGGPGVPGYMVSVNSASYLDGAHTIAVTATDNDDSSTTASIGVSFSNGVISADTTAPVITLNPIAATTMETSVTVSGSVDDRFATVRVNNIATTVDASGNFARNVLLAIGANTITVTATDTVGNARTVSASIERIRVPDTTAPLLNVTPLPATTMEASILVTGTVDEIDAVISIGSETTLPNGSGAFSRTVALTVGVNALVVRATDPSGNVATKVVSTERLVDVTAPVITLGAIPDSTTAATIAVSGSIDDTRATVKVNNVAVAVSAAGSFSTTLALNEGANTITVVATDIAGNARTTTKSIVRIITWDPNDPYGPYRIPSAWQGHQFTPSPVDWRHLAVYQVMTDRFADADATNNTKHAFSTDFSANGSIKPYEGHRRTIGGDFKGLTENLDYIKSLGFDVLWISAPLMGTEANGYAPATYGVLDSKLGTVEEFRKMVDEAHARGMYVVVDCVSNHFANWFADNETFNGNGYGAPQYATAEPKRYGPNFGDPLSPNDFHNFGKISNWTDGFQLEKGELVGLDDLKTEDAWVRNYVIEKWSNMIKALDVDGFRVDAIKHVNVADMGTFSAAWRAAAASVGKNNFFMFGEAFSGDHGAVGYYTGNKSGTGNRVMNGMMDYAMYQQGIPWKLFTDQWALKNWISGMNNASYDMGQGNGTSSWTPGNLNVHFAENHDLARFLSSVGDRDQMAAMTAMLTTIEGLGAMYYGGEQGFNTGGTDGRGAYAAMFDHDFEWDAALGDNFNMTHPLYKSIAKIMRARRRISSGLGTTTTLNDPQNGIFSFSRGSNAVVAINGTANSATATLPFPSGSPGTFVDLVSGATVSGASASVTLPKFGTAIFIRGGATAVLEPLVESITPGHGTTSGETTIVITFDRDMDPATAVAAASVTPSTGGTWSVSGNKLTLSGATFAVGTEYTVRVARSAKGTNNVAMAGGFISRFRGGSAGSGGTVVSPSISGTNVTFRYQGGATAGIKGSWKVTGGSNGTYTAIYDATWNAGATTPMVNVGGVWTVTIGLQAGQTYEYGFVINNAWTNDPLNPTHAGNGNDQVALASGAALPNVTQTTLDLNAGVLIVEAPTGTATGANVATGLASSQPTFVALPITSAQSFSAATAEQTLNAGSKAETYVAVLTNVNKTKFDVTVPVYSAATGSYSDRFTLSLEFVEPVSSFVARRVQDMLLGGAVIGGGFGGNVFGFEAFDAAGRDMGASETRVIRAKLTYHSDAGTVNGKPLRDLALNYFNPTTKTWEPLATTFDALGNSVSATLRHLSVYNVAPGGAGIQASLSNVIIYPNPFIPTDNNADNGVEYVAGDLTSGIIFDRLTDNVTITVYTLRGAKVSEQVVTTGRAQWDVKTSSGDPVATGVYLVVIKDNRGRGTHTEKISVVR